MIRRCAGYLFANKLSPSTAFCEYNAIKRSYAIGAPAETGLFLPPEWNTAKPFKSIPGPPTLPIIGNSWRFIGGVDFLKIMKQMNEKYGDVVSMRKLIGIGDLTILFNVRDIEWVLRNDGPWPRRIRLESLHQYRHFVRKDVFGDIDGLANGQDEAWASFRTAVNPIMMQPRITHQYIPHLNEIADEFIQHVKKLRSYSDKSEMPEDFANEINKWAFESIIAIALDTRLGVLSVKPSAKAEQAMKYILETFELIFRLDFMPFGKLHIKYNTSVWKKFVRSQDYFTAMFFELIEQAQEKISKNLHYTEKPQHEKSVFERLVANDKQVAIVMTLDLMAAGVDTSGKIVAAALYFLAKSEKSQTELRRELKRLLPNKNTSITKAVLDDAKYLRAVIKETMRIAPVSIGPMRHATKPMVIGGYQIPVGTLISMPTLYLSKMTDKHFANPDKFIPERWIREIKTDTINPFLSLPFGFGARSCIGKRMASMEIEVIIAKMVRNFVLEWPHKDMTFKQRLMYGVGDPLKFKFTDVPK